MNTSGCHICVYIRITWRAYKNWVLSPTPASHSVDMEGATPGFAFLTSSQMILHLWEREPHFKNHWWRLSNFHRRITMESSTSLLLKEWSTISSTDNTRGDCWTCRTSGLIPDTLFLNKRKTWGKKFPEFGRKYMEWAYIILSCWK